MTLNKQEIPEPGNPLEGGIKSYSSIHHARQALQASGASPVTDDFRTVDSPFVKNEKIRVEHYDHPKNGRYIAIHNPEKAGEAKIVHESVMLPAEAKHFGMKTHPIVPSSYKLYAYPKDGRDSVKPTFEPKQNAINLPISKPEPAENIQNMLKISKMFPNWFSKVEPDWRTKQNPRSERDLKLPKSPKRSSDRPLNVFPERELNEQDEKTSKIPYNFRTREDIGGDLTEEALPETFVGTRGDDEFVYVAPETSKDFTTYMDETGEVVGRGPSISRLTPKKDFRNKLVELDHRALEQRMNRVSPDRRDIKIDRTKQVTPTSFAEAHSKYGSRQEDPGAGDSAFPLSLPLPKVKPSDFKGPMMNMLKISKLFPNWVSNLQKEDLSSSSPGTHPLHGQQMHAHEVAPAMDSAGIEHVSTLWNKDNSLTHHYSHPKFGKFLVHKKPAPDMSSTIVHVGGNDAVGQLEIANRKKREQDEFNRYGSAGN